MKLMKTIECDDERVTVMVEDPTVVVGDDRAEVLLGILATMFDPNLGIANVARVDTEQNGSDR